MVSPCIVNGCKNIGRHRFPKDEIRRAQWVQAIKYVQPGLSIRKHSLICSAHFKRTDFAVTPTCFTKLEHTPKILKKNSIPSIFPWTILSQQLNLSSEEQRSSSPQLVFDASNIKATYSKAPPVAFVEMQPILDEQIETDKQEDPLQLSDEEAEESQYQEHIEPDIDDIIDDNVVCLQLPDEEAGSEYHQILEADMVDNTIEIGSKSVHTQTEPEKYKFSQQESQPVATQTDYFGSGFSLYNYKHEDKFMHFYTGLENFHKFMLSFNSLGQSAYNLKYFNGAPPEQIDVLEQYFITLIILRRHKTYEEISMMFKIRLKHVYTIFITWIKFMALQWKKIDLWVDRETITAAMPFDFYEKYPSTRLILDATESPIKKPKLPLAQQITFSSYKNRNTIKFLIGITPGGLISYVSPSYGGSATDRQILERSPILNKFDYNDEVMVDKGFNVQDMFIPYGVKVNMPAFFKKGNQIESQVLSANRKVASKRVHVERVIGMLKTYKILTEPMNQTEILLSSDIVFVIAMLVNFRSNIINKNA